MSIIHKYIICTPTNIQTYYKLLYIITHLQFIHLQSKELSDADRSSFAALNQLFCGHSKLHYHLGNINTNISELCETCKVPEIMEHFLFGCVINKKKRDTLGTSLTKKRLPAVPQLLELYQQRMKIRTGQCTSDFYQVQLMFLINT